MGRHKGVEHLPCGGVDAGVLLGIALLKCCPYLW